MSILKQWLASERPEFFTFRWIGRAKELYSDYITTVPLLLDTIRSATPNERKEFYEEIYETLYVMADNDDADSINAIFSLCHDLPRENYYDGISPLGNAIEHNALRAIEALVSNGMSPDDCSFGLGDYSIEFALSCAAQDSTILHLVQLGANVEASTIVSLFVYDQRMDLVSQMLSKSKNIHNGTGVAGLISCIEDELSIYQKAFGEKEKSGYLTLLDYLRLHH